MFKILHFYKDELNLYGDSGNILYLQHFLSNFGIESSVDYVDKNTKTIPVCDFIFAGGGPDLLQNSIYKDFLLKKEYLNDHIQQGKPALFICGSYQLLGKYYLTSDDAKIPGLSLFDYYTYSPKNQKKRLVGNLVGSTEFSVNYFPSKVVGFENHNGRTILNGLKPFSIVNSKFVGNNDTDYTEGFLYKKTIGTYFHGPLLVKNPQVLFFLLQGYISDNLKIDPRILSSEFLSYKNALTKQR